MATHISALCWKLHVNEDCSRCKTTKGPGFQWLVISCSCGCGKKNLTCENCSPPDHVECEKNVKSTGKKRFVTVNIGGEEKVVTIPNYNMWETSKLVKIQKVFIYLFFFFAIAIQNIFFLLNNECEEMHFECGCGKKKIFKNTPDGQMIPADENW